MAEAPLELTERYRDALTYAARKHDGQPRKGTRTPYLAHPLGVSSLVLEHGGSENEAIAALLHDVPEDCGGRPELEEIRRRFGEEVARIVEGCTDTFEDPKPAWRERKEQYLAHLANASAQVRLVSAADKLHNARAILSDLREVADELWKRFPGRSPGEIVWYYRSLATAFRRHGRNAVVDELDRTVTAIEEIVKSTNRD